jgi:hypothetical protein
MLARFCAIFFALELFLDKDLAPRKVALITHSGWRTYVREEKKGNRYLG